MTRREDFLWLFLFRTRAVDLPLGSGTSCYVRGGITTGGSDETQTVQRGADYGVQLDKGTVSAIGF